MNIFIKKSWMNKINLNLNEIVKRKVRYLNIYHY